MKCRAMKTRRTETHARVPKVAREGDDIGLEHDILRDGFEPLRMTSRCPVDPTSDDDPERSGAGDRIKPWVRGSRCRGSEDLAPTVHETRMDETSCGESGVRHQIRHTYTLLLLLTCIHTSTNIEWKMSCGGWLRRRMRATSGLHCYVTKYVKQ